MKLNKTRSREKTNQNTGRSPTFSYRAARNQADSSDRKERISLQEKDQSKKTGKYRYVLLFRRAVFIFLLIIIGFNLRVGTSPAISYKSDDGNISRDKAVYDDGISQIWKSNILNQTKPTIQTRKISQQITQRFPEISSIYVDIPIVGIKPIVEVEFAKPRLILTAQANSFYLDSMGQTLALTEEVNANSLGSLPMVVDESGLVPKVGNLALSSEETETILIIYNLFRVASVDIDKMTLPTEPNQIDIELEGRGYTLKLALDQSPEQGVGAYLALDEKLRADNITPSSYVDLRVPDKAFYR